MQTEQGKMLNESAKFEMLGTAATQGGFAGSDGKLGGAEMYNFLQHHNGSVSAVLGDEQAKIFGHERGGRFNLSMTPDGKVVATEATRGSMDNTYDVNKLIISGGTEIDQGTAFQMALKGDKKLVGQVTNPYISEGSRNAEISALSSALGKSASQFMQRQGVSADFTRGDAHLSLGAGGGIVFGASGRVGGERVDRKSTDLMTQQYGTLIRGALGEAKEKGLDMNDTRNLLSSRIENYTNAFYTEAQRHKPDNFGASAPLSVVKEAIDSVGIVPSPYHPGNRQDGN